MRLRCYCCGQPLGESFALVSSGTPGQPTHNIWPALPQHALHSQEVQVLRVQRMPIPGTNVAHNLAQKAPKRRK
jgi:hypothetical protein